MDMFLVFTLIWFYLHIYCRVMNAPLATLQCGVVSEDHWLIPWQYQCSTMRAECRLPPCCYYLGYQWRVLLYSFCFQPNSNKTSSGRSVRCQISWLLKRSVYSIHSICTPKGQALNQNYRISLNYGRDLANVGYLTYAYSSYLFRPI